MNLYIMRHGETDWNEQGILQGSTDISLNARGVEMAEQTSIGLKRDNITFDKIFSSPYLRAKETAEIIAKGSGEIITVTPLLREMCFGKYEGHNIRSFRTNPENAQINKFFCDPANYQQEGNAESFEQVFDRIQKFLTDYIMPLEDTYENVLIVCHGAIIRALICLVNKISLVDYWSIHVPNCSIIHAKVKNGQIYISDKKTIYYEYNKSITERFYV